MCEIVGKPNPLLKNVVIKKTKLDRKYQTLRITYIRYEVMREMLLVTPRF